MAGNSHWQVIGPLRISNNKTRIEKKAFPPRKAGNEHTGISKALLPAPAAVPCRGAPMKSSGPMRGWGEVGPVSDPCSSCLGLLFGYGLCIPVDLTSRRTEVLPE